MKGEIHKERYISIHPPPARWDAIFLPIISQPPHFNPPTSCEVGREASLQRDEINISIHPPPARWDVRGTRVEPDAYISIHPPPARWDNIPVCNFTIAVFQSTHLLRGGTGEPHLRGARQGFQSTHLLRGGTPALAPPVERRNFNPPTSCEVGLCLDINKGEPFNISIHPPPARWDLSRPYKPYPLQISIHPPPARWDLNPIIVIHITVFQSTHLLRGGTEWYGLPAVLLP